MKIKLNISGREYTKKLHLEAEKWYSAVEKENTFLIECNDGIKRNYPKILFITDGEWREIALTKIIT